MAQGPVAAVFLASAIHVTLRATAPDFGLQGQTQKVMARSTSTAAGIPTFEHCNLDRDADFPPLYFAPLETRSELPRTFPHRHSYFHLFWVTQGNGRHMVDFRDHAVRDRSIFIVAPGQIHFWAVEPNTTGFLFNFNAEIFAGAPGGASAQDEQLRLRVQGCPAFYPDAAQARAIDGIIELIAAEYCQPGPDSTQVVTHLFQVLLLRILRIEQPDEVSRPGTAIGLAQRFCMHVERQFRHSCAIVFYAEILHVSERTLAEATKRALGKTPKEIVQDRLLLEAKRLLIHSDMAVADIAFHLNFEDPAYFGRFFRKRAAMSPGEFKKAMLDPERVAS